MQMNTNRKAWSQPAILSVEQMRNAANGSQNGLSKGPLPTEYTFDGPGS